MTLTATKAAYATASIECEKAYKLLGAAIECVNKVNYELDTIPDEAPTYIKFAKRCNELYDIKHFLFVCSEDFKENSREVEGDKTSDLEVVLNKLDKTMNELLQTLRD